MQKPELLLCCADRAREDDLRAVVAEHAVCVARDPEEVTRALIEHRPPALIAYVASARDPFLTAVSQAAADGVRVGVVGPARDPEVLLAALRAGARDYIADGEREELKRAARSLLKTRGQGKVVSIFACKGGAGATTIACNLADELARRRRRVCVVDLDRHFGDVLAFLDLPGGYCLSDVSKDQRRLDRELLDASLASHASGVYVVAQSSKPDEGAQLQADGLAAVLTFLRQHFDWLLVDGLRGLEPLSLAALDASDQAMLVLTADVPAVRNAQHAVELLRGAGYEAEKLRLLVNRHQKAARIAPEVIAETTGVSTISLLAEDAPAAAAAMNHGQLLSSVAPRSRLRRDLAALAGTLCEEPQEAGLMAGFWSGLFSKKAVTHGSA